MAAADQPPPARRWDLICLDWGGTLMSEAGPTNLPMALWPQVQRMEGALELLARLSAENERLCIATNASVSRKPQIQKALERVGLLRFIDHIFCYTDVGYRKNEAGFWQAVRQHYQLPDLRGVAMLGDSLEQDVLAPLQHGVGLAVWFNPLGAPASVAGAPVPQVRHLIDALPLWLAGPATPTR